MLTSAVQRLEKFLKAGVDKNLVVIFIQRIYMKLLLIFLSVVMINFDVWCNEDASEMEVVSIVELVVRPERFESAYVSVVGVFSFDLDSSTLFLNREHYKVDLFDTSISVDFPKGGTVADIEKLNALSGCYVRVDGIFSSKDRGYMGLNKGSIKNVSKIEKYFCFE